MVSFIHIICILFTLFILTIRIFWSNIFNRLNFNSYQAIFNTININDSYANYKEYVNGRQSMILCV